MSEWTFWSPDAVASPTPPYLHLTEHIAAPGGGQILFHFSFGTLYDYQYLYGG